MEPFGTDPGVYMQPSRPSPVRIQTEPTLDQQLAAKLLRHFEEENTLSQKNNCLTDKTAINFPLHPPFRRSML